MTIDPTDLAAALRQHAAAVQAVADDLRRHVHDDDDSIDGLASKGRHLVVDLRWEAALLDGADSYDRAPDRQAVALLRLAARLLADRSVGETVHRVVWDLVWQLDGEEAADSEAVAWRAVLAAADGQVPA